MKTVSLFLWTLAALFGCKSKDMDDVPYVQPATNTAPVPMPTGNGTAVTYLALGDSYTIGETVTAPESFPYQLTAELNKLNYKAAAPVIIARTGWTTDELINAISVQNLAQKFDIVTLLIGVNNQYRGYNINTYRTEFVQLLNTAISYANGNKKHVFVVSIPDWGVTPYASGRDRNKIAAEIDQYNAINKQETEKAGISYTNITPGSRLAAQDRTLIAADGLHPSGKMYAQWVQQLIVEVAKSLK
ncbi:SGNH/GDSL hydrolase family protein [Mucilaginibacter lacusdianchii]|uniref:SGNH/GDSL hydrolase family protein n=1 Tax=Mucilaginibacter lacusdianchii TaxID=2684211 RepID=UPI00131E325C|nr:SGNH/GDSL hydrolase family protein [Mucilaginibacter sp. JXJ CY 39]